MAYAHNPCPADESTFVTDSNLYWSTGTNATSHDVYFGTNFNDVDNATRMQGDLDGDRQVGLGDLKILASQWLAADALLLANIDSAGSVTFQDFAKLAQNWGLTSNGTPYKGKQPGNTYSPGTLLYDTTYYWRIDEVNDESTKAPERQGLEL